MAKMIKNLTTANIRNIEGFERREDLDFSDDGNRFRGFSYKGMPITTLRSHDETYLSIRVDYLENNFTYKEWMETKEYFLCNEFNGVYEIDLDKLIENLEKVIAKVDEMNKKAANELIDTSKVEERVAYEVENAESIVEDMKKSFNWFEASEFEIRRWKDIIRSTMNKINRAKSYDFSTMDIRNKRALTERFKIYGFVEFKENDFYLTEMKKYLGK